jgi:hypothetical protein
MMHDGWQLGNGAGAPQEASIFYLLSPQPDRTQPIEQSRKANLQM